MKKSLVLIMAGLLAIVAGLASAFPFAVVNVYDPNAVPAIVIYDPSGTETVPFVKTPNQPYVPYVEFNVTMIQGFSINGYIDKSWADISGIGRTFIYAIQESNDVNIKAYVYYWQAGAPASGKYSIAFHVTVEGLGREWVFDVTGWVIFESIIMTWYINGIQVSGRGVYEVIGIPGPVLNFKAVPSGDTSQITRVFVRIWDWRAGISDGDGMYEALYPAGDYVIEMVKQSDGSYVGSWTSPRFDVFIVHGYYVAGGSTFKTLAISLTIDDVITNVTANPSFLLVWGGTVLVIVGMVMKKREMKG